VHIVNNRYQYGKTEDFVDITDYAEQGKIVNIKEGFYMFIF
jgi:hypothetical protein